MESTAKLQMHLPCRLDPPCRRIQTVTADCFTAWAKFCPYTFMKNSFAQHDLSQSLLVQIHQWENHRTRNNASTAWHMSRGNDKGKFGSLFKCLIRSVLALNHSYSRFISITKWVYLCNYIISLYAGYINREQLLPEISIWTCGFNYGMTDQLKCYAILNRTTTTYLIYSVANNSGVMGDILLCLLAYGLSECRGRVSWCNG